jgi:putative peptide zinc metalloprotease protein
MEPLLTPDWYRVAQMRPRLRAGVRVSPQPVRGEAWYVLTDPLSGRHHRFNEVAYRLIAACDGKRTLDEVWAAHAAASGDAGDAGEAGDDAPTQGETVRVVAQAFAANLFVGDVAPDVAAIVKAQLRGQRQRTRAAVNPLAFKVPLWDPDAFLAAHIDRWRCLFTPAIALAVLLVAALGALLLATNAADYTAFARTHLGSGRMLLILWLAYPLIKAVHELAHALAVKAFGGEVHEIGVTLLMLTPVPYVDASASMGFASKRQRIAVAGAGIAVELVLASLALCLWLALEPGLLKDIAFAVVLVGGVSTLAINGNPLLRFDGYHMLCDQLELPNLARRSQQWWIHLAKRGLLRVQGARFDGHARGAMPWLLAYAPLSWLYRAFLLALLSVWLAEQSSLLGLAALAFALWLCLLQPGFSALRYVARSAELHGQRGQAVLVALVGATLLGGLLFAAPLPHQTRAPGVVWLQDEALVRLGTDGFVEQFMAADGDEVVAGQPLLQLSNDELQTALQRARSQLARLEVERAASFDADALRAGVAEDERQRLQAEHARLQQRAEQLLVRAAVAGRLVIAPGRGIVGQYLPQGQLVAHVLAPGAPLVRALVRNEDIAQVREGSTRIEVALAHAPGLLASGRLTAAVPRASATLPSAALGDAAGGSIALDASDKSGRTALEPRFQLDLRLGAEIDARVGARALVTFSHADASAAALMFDFARRSFLRHFER